MDEDRCSTTSQDTSAPSVERLFMPVRCCQRYGGLAQTYPLTDAERLYDDTCKEIDNLERQIGAMSMSLFTAAEYGWFIWFVNKMWIFPKQPQLDKQLADLKDLLLALQMRALPPTEPVNDGTAPNTDPSPDTLEPWNQGYRP